MKNRIIRMMRESGTATHVTSRRQILNSFLIRKKERKKGKERKEKRDRRGEGKKNNCSKINPKTKHPNRGEEEQAQEEEEEEEKEASWTPFHFCWVQPLNYLSRSNPPLKFTASGSFH